MTSHDDLCPFYTEWMSREERKNVTVSSPIELVAFVCIGCSSGNQGRRQSTLRRARTTVARKNHFTFASQDD